MEHVTRLPSNGRCGPQPSLGEFLGQHVPELHAFIRARGRSLVRATDSIADIVQSVCRELLDRRRQFRHGGEAGMKRWMFTMVMRKLVGRQRYHLAAKRGGARAGVEGFDASRADLNEDRSAGGQTPSRIAGAREQLALVDETLPLLADDQRRALVLTAIGCSHREIGAELNRSEEAAKKLVCRARARLVMLLMQAGSHRIQRDINCQ